MSSDAEFTLSAVFDTVAGVHPDRPCLVWGDVRITFAELADRSRRLATYLRSRGLGSVKQRDGLAGHESGQDHLGIYLYNGNQYLEALLGAFRARVAPFNVNYRYVEDELVYLLDNAGCRALVYHAAFAPTLAAIRAGDSGSRCSSRWPTTRARAAARRGGLRGGAGRRRPRGRSGTVTRRPLHPLHRRHDRHAQGRAVAPARHLHVGHGRRNILTQAVLNSYDEVAQAGRAFPSRSGSWSCRRSCTVRPSGPRSSASTTGTPS